MSTPGPPPSRPSSLYHLLDPEVLADPYPLYRRLRDEDPVHWDPYLHAWVVTRYEDVVTVLPPVLGRPHARRPRTSRRSACREVAPIAAGDGQADAVPGRAGAHAAARAGRARRSRRRASRTCASTSRQIADRLIDDIVARGDGRLDLLADFAEPLPAIVTAEMLGVPVEDHDQLKDWSVTFAEMLGNFQHNPGPARRRAARRSRT